MLTQNREDKLSYKKFFNKGFKKGILKKDYKVEKFYKLQKLFIKIIIVYVNTHTVAFVV